MTEWFSALSGFEQVYWLFAGVGSMLFLFVLVTTILGGEADGLDGDVDVDVESDTGIGFQFLTFKNLVAFFTLFGWIGISCISYGMGKGMTVVLSIIAGLIMMFIMAFLILQISKLVSSGTLQMKNAVGHLGQVYLTVGASSSRVGKVQVTVQGTLRELEALTNETSDLETGTVVKVTGVTDNGMLIVEKVNN